MKNYIAVCFVLLCTLAASAQTVGNFTATNIVTGKPVSLNDFNSSAGVVIIFTSNATTCAYDQYYADRLKTISNQYGSKVPVIFVNSHVEEGESEATKAMAASLGARYLIDTDQKIMQSFKATKSPEAFLLKNTNGSFSVFYYGAIDDNAQVASDVSEHYLNDAINALLTDQKPKSPTVRPLGCTIRRR